MFNLNAFLSPRLTHQHTCSRTGIIYNVTPSAVGVIINKVVGNRYIEKRVNLRVEHIRHSKCRQEFLDRVQRNHDLHAAAKAKGGECDWSTMFLTPHVHRALSSERVSLKRQPVHPRGARTISTKDNAPQTMTPVRYETTI